MVIACEVAPGLCLPRCSGSIPHSSWEWIEWIVEANSLAIRFVHSQDAYLVPQQRCSHKSSILHHAMVVMVQLMPSGGYGLGAYNLDICAFARFAEATRHSRIPTASTFDAVIVLSLNRRTSSGLMSSWCRVWGLKFSAPFWRKLVIQRMGSSRGSRSDQISQGAVSDVATGHLSLARKPRVNFRGFRKAFWPAGWRGTT